MWGSGTFFALQFTVMCLNLNFWEFVPGFLKNLFGNISSTILFPLLWIYPVSSDFFWTEMDFIKVYLLIYFILWIWFKSGVFSKFPQNLKFLLEIVISVNCQWKHWLMRRGERVVWLISPLVTAVVGLFCFIIHN